VLGGWRVDNASPDYGFSFPREIVLSGWLGGALQWHVAAMWIIVVNGLVYLTFVYLHGEWRDLVPRKGDIRDSVQMVKFYTFRRKDHPHQGKHNALQKLAYFTMPWLGVVLVLTGLAIWKPVELGWLTAIFGGYVWARYWHFLAMIALVVLSITLASIFYPDSQQRVLNFVDTLAPGLHDFIAQNLKSYLGGRISSSIIAIGFLVWSGKNLFMGLAYALDRALGVPKGRPLIHNIVLSIVMLPIMAVMLVIAMGLPVIMSIK